MSSLINGASSTASVASTALTASTASTTAAAPLSAAASGASSASGAMSQNVPKCPIPSGALSPKQCLAIDLLILGKTSGDIARAIETDRRTLYRWRHDDPDF